jgi:hypothetical protein
LGKVGVAVITLLPIMENDGEGLCVIGIYEVETVEEASEMFPWIKDVTLCECADTLAGVMEEVTFSLDCGISPFVIARDKVDFTNEVVLMLSNEEL